MLSLQLLFIASFIVSVYSEPIYKVPLYKRNSFVSASAIFLQNGMLGAVVQIGNPPQNLTLAFDTSSSFTWARGIDCINQNCLDRQAYNPKVSDSAIETMREFRLDYGKGVVDSHIFLDTFRYGGLSVRDMPFGVADRIDNFDRGFDGFLGLGRRIDLEGLSRRRSMSDSGFAQNAYQQGYGMESSQFGMYTTNSGNGFNQDSFGKRELDAPAGYLVLGGLDTSAIQGKVNYVETCKYDGSGRWAVSVNQAKFIHDDHFNVSKKSRAILFSSTDVIGLPNEQANAFEKKWYAAYSTEDNTYSVPCCLMNRLSSFKIQLGPSLNITLPPSYWSHPKETETCCDMCRTHIGRSDSEDDYILGYTFTQALYTQFDDVSNRIGFALKKNSEIDLFK